MILPDAWGQIDVFTRPKNADLSSRIPDQIKKNYNGTLCIDHITLKGFCHEKIVVGSRIKNILP